MLLVLLLFAITEGADVAACGNHLCYSIPAQRRTWEDAFSVCRDIHGFLMGRELLSETSTMEDNTINMIRRVRGNEQWTSIKELNGHYQWMDPVPAKLSYKDEQHRWKGIKGRWSRRWETKGCVKMRVGDWNEIEFIPTSCEEKLGFICVISNIVELSDRKKPAPALHVYKGQSPLQHSHVVITKDEVSLMRLHCNTTGGFWVMNGVVVGSADQDLHLYNLTVQTLTNAYSNPLFSKQGSFWCETWQKRSTNRVQSKEVLITFKEVATMVVELQMNTSYSTVESCNDAAATCIHKTGCWLVDYACFLNVFNLHTWWDIRDESMKLLPSKSHYNLQATAHLYFYIQRKHLENKLLPSISKNDLYQYNNWFKGRLKFVDICLENQVMTFPSGTFYRLVDKPEVIFPSMTKLCLNKKKEIIPRQCIPNFRDGASWDSVSKEKCDSIQIPVESANTCPPGFERHEGYCVSVKSEATWGTHMESCVQMATSKATPPEELMGHPNVTGDEIWVTARRKMARGPVYKCSPTGCERVMTGWDFEEPSPNNECAAFNKVGNFALVTKDCSSHLPTICYFPRLEYGMETGNSSLMEIPNGCEDGGTLYIVYWSWELCVWSEINVEMTWEAASASCGSMDAHLPDPHSPFMQTFLRLILTRRVPSSYFPVWLDLEDIDDAYRWGHSKRPLEFVNWSPETDYGNGYGAMIANGSWVLLNENQTLSQLVCVRHHRQRQSPSLELTLKEDEHKVEVIPHNFTSLSLTCYQDGEKLKNLSVDYHEVFPWKIFCEQWMPGYGLVSSNTVPPDTGNLRQYWITLLDKEETFSPAYYDATFFSEKKSAYEDLLEEYVEMQESRDTRADWSLYMYEMKLRFIRYEGDQWKRLKILLCVYSYGRFNNTSGDVVYDLLLSDSAVKSLIHQSFPKGGHITLSTNLTLPVLDVQEVEDDHDVNSGERLNVYIITILTVILWICI